MRINTSKKTTTVTNEDFGDMFEGETFEFKIDSMSIKEQAIFSEKYDIEGDDVKNSEYIEFMAEMFINTVSEWSGLEGPDGEIECTKENKALVFEHDFDFCRLIIEKSAEKSSAVKKK